MLLNRALTVRPGNPASHRGKGWEAVTECAIRALVARGTPLVAILWGRDASTLKPMLGDGVGVIESAHPVAAVGVAGILRVATVQSGQPTAQRNGRRADRLAAALEMH